METGLHFLQTSFFLLQTCSEFQEAELFLDYERERSSQLTSAAASPARSFSSHQILKMDVSHPSLQRLTSDRGFMVMAADASSDATLR